MQQLFEEPPIFETVITTEIEDLEEEKIIPVANKPSEVSVKKEA